MSPDELPPDVSIDVNPPVEYNGRKWEMLHIREPTAGQVRKAEGHFRGNPMNATAEQTRNYQYQLIASVADWPVPAVELLGIMTLNAAWECVSAFLGRSRPTGVS